MLKIGEVCQKRAVLWILAVATTCSVAAQASDFAVLLSGSDGEERYLEGVESVNIDDIVIDTRSFWMRPEVDDEVLVGAMREGYRVYGPGDAHYGSITIRSRVGKDNTALHQWYQDTSQGKNIRKSISVIALKRDGSEARRWNFFECFPTRWEAADYSPSSDARTETIVCKMGRVELASIDTEEPPGDMRVTLESDGSVSQFDMWRWAGGEPRLVMNNLVRRSFTRADTPGRFEVGEIEMRGFIDGGRKALCEWITATVKGQPWKRTLVVKEILKDGSDGKTFTYLDCFPTRYVFPAFSASGTGNLYEEVCIKPIRLETR